MVSAKMKKLFNKLISTTSVFKRKYKYFNNSIKTHF